ncbi:expressed protein [Chlorella variabilis]|uniref:Expressed protein n=1 Tax=Chlorella variabilis TaxID=554065 RepID=E1ZFB3_CHLVA|nr:expressed protein [Chlorella variabilis]EFN55640.1 expressed protein [Chlorella variabilis]|eukprot:XP_005847742.1 expressed protein [Chlorella variabilis]
MQAVCAVAKPFAASGARAPRSSSSRAAVVRAAVAGEPEQQPLLARRSVAGLLAAAPVLLPASRALALIPDDDDEELVQKARANRQARLASERQAEQAFSRSARGLDRVLEQELIPVQKAINSLAISGAALEAGDVKAAASALSGSWVRDFQSATEKLSYTDAAKSSAASVLSSLSALEGAAASGSASDAKRGFVATVGSFKAWVSAANIASDLRGL